MNVLPLRFLYGPLCPTLSEGEAKETVKDSIRMIMMMIMEMTITTFPSAAVLSVSDKSRFACTVIRALSVVTNGIHMTTMPAFLTFVDIYG